MEETGIVLLVRFLEEKQQLGVDIAPLSDMEQLVGGFDFAVLADAQEKDAVDGGLDGVIKLAFRAVEVGRLLTLYTSCRFGCGLRLLRFARNDGRSLARRLRLLRFARSARNDGVRGGAEVAQGDIAGKQEAPLLDLFEEFRVHLSGAAFALAALGVAVERAVPDGIFGENFCKFVPTGEVFFEGKEHHAASGGGILGVRAGAAIVDRQLFEISQDRERQMGVPGVTAQLVSWVDVVTDVDRRFFGFDEEFAGGADAESVVGGFERALVLEGVFVDDLAVLGGEVGAIVHIPTEGFKKRVEEFLAELGFVVATGAVELTRVAEAVDEVLDDGWCAHLPPGE